MKAREIMTRSVVTVPTWTTVQDAARLLVSRGFTALPVIDEGGKLVGIVSEADLLRDRIPADPRIHGIGDTPCNQSNTVAGVMTTSVESLTPGADASDAARMMIDENIRCLPVVDGVGVVGVITRRDLLRLGVVHNDHDTQRAVNSALEKLGSSGRWSASVRAGVVDIEDFRDVAADRQSAATAAAAVPGVVAAVARHQTCDPF